MKIYSAEKIRLWDQYTIQQEPITSIALMERAAGKCVEWLQQNNYQYKPFAIFCGKGNNGGDGLAIARLLSGNKNNIRVYIIDTGKKGTADFETNLSRLSQQPGISIQTIGSVNELPVLAKDEIVIDALFGSGLNRGLDGIVQRIVEHLNDSGNTIIAVDMPSGLFTDQSSKMNKAIKANFTLTFQSYKLALLMPENAGHTGKVVVLDIGLHPQYELITESRYELIDKKIVQQIYTPRNSFSHKGNFGHALLIAGSYGKIGAAVLSARSCLRSGVGLLTIHVPKCGYEIMQGRVPEAMVATDFNSSFCTRVEDDLNKYKTIGIGPGLGTAAETRSMLKELLTTYNRPLVIDADALNILSQVKGQDIPAGSVITPHPKEFERLFGSSSNDFERMELAMRKAKELSIIIVLKGHHTLIALPEGKGFFNSTGNAGMATGGSGDVLTGLLTGLIAQGYAPDKAAILGVYLHGMAGDIAAKKLSMEAMIAGDIVESLGDAFKDIQVV